MIHLGNLIIPLSYLYWISDKYEMLFILGTFTLFFIAVDLGRIHIKWIRDMFTQYFNFMMRSHELQGQLTGATWVMIGACLVVLLFPREIAILSLIFMSIGDTTAGLIGKAYGKTAIGEKTLEGFLAGLVICLTIAWFFPAAPRMVAVSGAIAAMVIEILPLPLDDNLSMPLGSGTIMLIINALSG